MLILFLLMLCINVGPLQISKVDFNYKVHSIIYLLYNTIRIRIPIKLQTLNSFKGVFFNTLHSMGYPQQHENKPYFGFTGAVSAKYFSHPLQMSSGRLFLADIEVSEMGKGFGLARRRNAICNFLCHRKIQIVKKGNKYL